MKHFSGHEQAVWSTQSWEICPLPSSLFISGSSSWLGYLSPFVLRLRLGGNRKQVSSSGFCPSEGSHWTTLELPLVEYTSFLGSLHLEIQELSRPDTAHASAAQRHLGQHPSPWTISRDSDIVQVVLTSGSWYGGVRSHATIDSGAKVSHPCIFETLESTSCRTSSRHNGQPFISHRPRLQGGRYHGTYQWFLQDLALHLVREAILLSEKWSSSGLWQFSQKNLLLYSSCFYK